MSDRIDASCRRSFCAVDYPLCGIKQRYYNKHKVICEQRLYINLCTQMKTIATITGLPMYAHWPGRVYVWGLNCVRARVNMRCVCVCVCGVCVWCVCVVCRVCDVCRV